MQPNKIPTAPAYAPLIILPTWLLLLLFVAPLIIALTIYINWNYIYIAKQKTKPSSQALTIQAVTFFDINDRPISLPPAKPQWSIIYLTPEICKQNCYTTKTTLTKIHDQLGKLQPKVALVTTPSSLVKVDNIHKYQTVIVKAGNILITDPNNQVISYYPRASTQILKDLQHLLTAKQL